VSAARKQSAAAAKKRRQTKIAVGGGVVLALLLAVQGPKTLKLLRGSSAAAPAAQPAAPTPGPAPAPAPGAPATSAAPAPKVTSLKELGNFDAPPAAGPNHLVAFNRFAPRDPFVRGSEYRTPGLEVARVPIRRPGTSRPPRGGPWPARGDAYTVVLASVSVRTGRAAAERRAQEMRARGLRRVGILVSSEFRSLRPGYFVVYSGVYETRRAAQRALARARAKAGRTAYSLRVAR
jgi:hypothetical protein